MRRKHTHTIPLMIFQWCTESLKAHSEHVKMRFFMIHSNQAFFCLYYHIPTIAAASKHILINIHCVFTWFKKIKTHSWFKNRSRNTACFWRSMKSCYKTELSPDGFTVFSRFYLKLFHILPQQMCLVHSKSCRFKDHIYNIAAFLMLSISNCKRSKRNSVTFITLEAVEIVSPHAIWWYFQWCQYLKTRY